MEPNELSLDPPLIALVTNQGVFQLLPLPVRGYFPLNGPSLPPPASSMLAFHASPPAIRVYVDH